MYLHNQNSLKNTRISIHTTVVLQLSSYINEAWHVKSRDTFNVSASGKKFVGWTTKYKCKDCIRDQDPLDDQKTNFSFKKTADYKKKRIRDTDNAQANSPH